MHVTTVIFAPEQPKTMAGAKTNCNFSQPFFFLLVYFLYGQHCWFRYNWLDNCITTGGFNQAGRDYDSVRVAACHFERLEPRYRRYRLVTLANISRDIQRLGAVPIR